MIKFPPVNLRSARHVQMLLTSFLMLFAYGWLFNVSRGNVENAHTAALCIGAYSVMIGFIEWRIRREGFDEICQAAGRLNSKGRQALITFLTKSEK